MAADLKKIDRTVKKEPAYQSRSPRYGLLVLGPKAETRLWLVFDSVPDPLEPGKARDYLYVDRNGNGDLTEPGERVAATVHKLKVDVSFGSGSYEETLLEFDVGDVKGAGEVHKGVKVVVEWYRGKERPVTVSAASGGRRQDSGAVVFAARPKGAPVVHVGGGLTFGLQPGAAFERGREKQLHVYLGTAGLGDGAFAALRVEDVPEGLHPVAEIEFPSPTKGGPGKKVTVALSKRC